MLISAKEYAEKHGKSKDVILLFCKDGRLKTAVKIGKAGWAIDSEEPYPVKRQTGKPAVFGKAFKPGKIRLATVREHSATVCGENVIQGFMDQAGTVPAKIYKIYSDGRKAEAVGVSLSTLRSGILRGNYVFEEEK